MNEKELIAKIESLKNIKPKEEWVLSAREEIFQEDKILFPFFLKEKVFIGTFLLLLFGGFLFVGGFAGNSFYARIASYFNSEDKNVAVLEEKKEVELLSSTLAELKETRSQLQQEFASSIVSKPEEEAIKIAKNYAPAILEIRKKEGKISETLGVRISEDDNTAEKEIVSLIIKDLEKRSLVTEDKKILEEAKSYFEKGEYLSSLKKALEIGNKNITEETTEPTETIETKVETKESN